MTFGNNSELYLPSYLCIGQKSRSCLSWSKMLKENPSTKSPTETSPISWCYLCFLLQHQRNITNSAEWFWGPSSSCAPAAGRRFQKTDKFLFLKLYGYAAVSATSVALCSRLQMIAAQPITMSSQPVLLLMKASLHTHLAPQHEYQWLPYPRHFSYSIHPMPIF